MLINLLFSLLLLKGIILLKYLLENEEYKERDKRKNLKDMSCCD